VSRRTTNPAAAAPARGRAARHDSPVSSDPFLDFDFHPDEDQVRVFTIPRSGLLLADLRTVVYEIRYGDVVMRHYAFADQWFKVNITTDDRGGLVETRSPDAGIPPFAINCDIATPLIWQDGNALAVDLFLDVLVREDARTYLVRDMDEFEDAGRHGLISPAEATGARAGLAALVRLIQDHTLMPFLTSVFPFGPSTAPAALPESTAPLSRVERLRPGRRVTW